MSSPTPPRRPRRWWRVLAVASALAIVLLAALPWMLASGPLLSVVRSRIDRRMAPGSLRFESLHLSWTGPTRLDRVTILDPEGVEVIRAASLTLDRSLARMIFRDQGPDVLAFEGAKLEVERSGEGKIDIVEALKTILASPDPTRSLTIRVVDGSLRYRDPVLAEAAVADSVDLTIHAPASPAQVTWSATFSKDGASLECRGDFDVWHARGGPPKAPQLQIGVVGKRWPLAIRAGGVESTGRLDGSMDFVRKRGRWVVSGDTRLAQFRAGGPAFRGDSLAFDRLEAGWDLAEGEDAWAIRRLSADCALGRLKAEGQLGGPGGSGRQRVEGQVDLAEVARQLPHALRLRDGLKVDRGTARVVVDLASLGGRASWEVEAKVADLSARVADGPPLALEEPASFRARVVLDQGDARLERLSVQTRFLDASASGGLEEGIVLSGSADLGALTKQLGEWVDLGPLSLDGRAKLDGKYDFEPSTLAYQGTLSATVLGLRVDGAGPWSIKRDSATFRVDGGGLCGSSGFPEGWRTLALVARSDQAEGRVELTTADGPARFKALASAPARLGDRTRPATFEAAGAWSADGRGLVLDRLQVALEPSAKGAPGSRIGLLARGKFDPATGELALDRAGEDPPGFLAIGLEGLRVSGLGRGAAALRFDGSVSGELRGLDQLFADATGRAPLGLEGRWSALGDVRGDGDGVALAARFGVDAPAGSTRPTGLAFRARYAPPGDRLDLNEFTVTTAYGTLDASGKLEEVSGARVVDLKGTLAPDFAAITALLASKVEPGARVKGKPRPFHASGPIGGEGSKAWRGLDAEVGFDLAEADVYGMKFGPSPVVLRARRGQLAFEPISTTLNEGHVRLEPEVDLDATGGPVLRLGKNSAIREARINDEVSRRVLAFVAPVLDQATRASGLVSVDLDHAEFPLGPGRGRQAKVEGAVVFQDVEFAPGPLAGEILGAIGRRDLTLKLDQPVMLTIADGRVNQRGMSIPLGELTRVDLAGWVDFDRNLSLRATLPVTPAMLGNNPLLSGIAAGSKIQLPISGTLDNPVIDREQFSANLQDLGKSLLTRGATRGAMELLMRLARPRDPDAPPPPPRPTPEDRKALRLEKRAQRRGEVPPPPTPGERPPL